MIDLLAANRSCLSADPIFVPDNDSGFMSKSVLSVLLPAHVLCLVLALSTVTWPHIAAAQDEPETENLFEIEEAFPNIRFEFPVDLANDGLGQLYVVERAGKIYTFPNITATQDTVLFLDISERVFDTDIEAGLLSVSFHPDYEENGHFYIYYLTDNPLRSVLSRYTRSEYDPRKADPGSEHIILELAQPSPKHNGGDSSFDADGYLYLSLGDGSTGADANGNAQNLETLLGSIIRIDVDHPDAGQNYGIPPDNPFVGNLQGYREEIYAYGFRNPWRFSIDPETGHIWVGDVGEVSWEEVDFVIKGGNYGWPMMEGPACFNPPENCSGDNLIPPVHSYDHDVGLSVTGGFVYRGSRAKELEGRYLFADWSGRQLWSLTYDGENPYESDEAPTVELITDAKRFISSFGVDENNEVYMLFTFEGRVMQFAETPNSDTEPPDVAEFSFEAVGPNPFSDRTSFTLGSRENGHIRVSVYDVLGREVDVLFDAMMAAGSKSEFYFDGSGLPSGVYFFRAQDSRGITTRKMVLTR